MTPVNPLHHIVMIAEMNRRLWLEVTGGQCTLESPHLLVPLPSTAISESFPVHEGNPVYPTVEIVGVVGSYHQVDLMSDFEVIFCNDLAYEVCGIDVIAKNLQSGRYVICEAKGTTGAFAAPGSYLKHTRKKGRQLTWQWIWSSLVDFADSPAASTVFLELYRPMIMQQDISRVLTVTKAEKVPGGYQQGSGKFWSDAELSAYDWFSSPKDWQKLRYWLQEMDAARRTAPHLHSEGKSGKGSRTWLGQLSRLERKKEISQ